MLNRFYCRSLSVWVSTRQMVRTFSFKPFILSNFLMHVVRFVIHHDMPKSLSKYMASLPSCP